MLRTFDTHRIRRTTELGGLWDFTVLPEEPAEGATEPAASEPAPAASRKVTVPSCWQTYPGLENYRGRARYSTTFEAEGNVRLEFKGVSHFARVELDGRLLGEHYNAYTPFVFAVPALAAGEHRLDVTVDNAFREDYALNFPNDYMSYGGISRPVALDLVPDTSIERVHVTPVTPAHGDGNGNGDGEGVWKAHVEVWCRTLRKPRAGTRMALRVELAGQTVEADVTPCEGEYEYLALATTVECPGVRPWTCEDPALYPVTATLLVNGRPADDLIDRVGFRTVRVNGDRIELNGKPIVIRGFCRHEDHPAFGNALPPQAMQVDLDLIEDMHGNAVRTSHYPNDERFLDMCDERGLLVWEENHARGMDEEHMRNPHFQAQAAQVIREMIETHYNHPSIVIWGILNECASNTAYGRECYERQYALIRELDVSRPVTSATCHMRDDMCLDLPDVVSWNIYPYWYEAKSATRMITDQLAYTREHGGAGKPLIISEIGAGAIYGFRNRDEEIWTEEYQANTLRKQLTEAFDEPAVTGVFIWQFCDVRVDREWWRVRAKRRNDKGIVDEFRRPKMAYDAVKEVFGEVAERQATV
ncbi:Glycosyl hydrolases family 2, TIM barrel domain-containing protein [Bifidobacterium sp. DSM 109958]|uniref:Glycosyl hydrolases family 2, TIM barrel domain-containing protein n=1 Tax=Bifidobacterium moraviense TaxID=2675323 RepID=A0A7Y0F2P5_9BIFI|nr:glycoside hydrolase family 2 TIM barrel-domain containing protein [Bifidobacterium sp. DSM 109958]NMN00946.1 Glycosyl hydrolases family 2, TIM barrel domain-containing protein [Bifidobacterium sp. DSM 109958]